MSQKRLIIDVREPHEYQSGHVDGAINLPLSGLSANSPQLNGIDKDMEIITYCRSGSRSQMAMGMLKQMGFSSITNGINAEQVAKV